MTRYCRPQRLRTGPELNTDATESGGGELCRLQGAAADTALSVWLDSGICLTTGTARLLSSTGECATSGPSDCRTDSAKKARGCLVAKDSGGGLFTSPPFLLPCTVGKRLLRTRETPFVAVLHCRFKESAAPGSVSEATAPSARQNAATAIPPHSWLKR